MGSHGFGVCMFKQADFKCVTCTVKHIHNFNLYRERNNFKIRQAALTQGRQSTYSTLFSLE